MTFQNRRWVIIFIFLCIASYTFATWWSMEQSDALIHQNRICRRLRKLKGPQRIFCRKEPQIVADIYRGIAIAMKRCQTEFRFQRWNCTTQRRILRNTLKHDSKEAAVLNAFAAAGISHTITESCTRGDLAQCGCGHVPEIEGSRYNKEEISAKKREKEEGAKETKWKWSGCKEALQFGNKVSRIITNGRVGFRNDVRTAIKIHNSEVGRKILKDDIRKTCKCHGLSGSCSYKTCSLKVPSMHHIGKILFQKYSQAIKVTSANDGNDIMSAEKWKKLKKEDLVYLEDSPNFCRKSLSEGSIGTQGRECVRHSSVPSAFNDNNCPLLCCGRGFTTKIEQVEEKCNCTFQFCCKVTCSKCRYTRHRQFCN